MVGLDISTLLELVSRAVKLDHQDEEARVRYKTKLMRKSNDLVIVADS
jgi:hypothetical protein